MSKSISKNSLKTDKKFRVSNPIKLFRSLVSCFGLAVLSMATDCGTETPAPNTIKSNQTRIRKNKPADANSRHSSSTSTIRNTRNYKVQKNKKNKPKNGKPKNKNEAAYLARVATKREELKAIIFARDLTLSNQDAFDKLVQELRRDGIEAACVTCNNAFEVSDLDHIGKEVFKLNCDCKVVCHADCIGEWLGTDLDAETCNKCSAKLTGTHVLSGKLFSFSDLGLIAESDLGKSSEGDDACEEEISDDDGFFEDVEEDGACDPKEDDDAVDKGKNAKNDDSFLRKELKLDCDQQCFSCHKRFEPKDRDKGLFILGCSGWNRVIAMQGRCTCSYVFHRDCIPQDKDSIKCPYDTCPGFEYMENIFDASDKIFVVVDDASSNASSSTDDQGYVSDDSKKSTPSSATCHPVKTVPTPVAPSPEAIAVNRKIDELISNIKRLDNLASKSTAERCHPMLLLLSYLKTEPLNLSDSDKDCMVDYLAYCYENSDKYKKFCTQYELNPRSECLEALPCHLYRIRPAALQWKGIKSSK